MANRFQDALTGESLYESVALDRIADYQQALADAQDREAYTLQRALDAPTLRSENYWTREYNDARVQVASYDGALAHFEAQADVYDEEARDREARERAEREEVDRLPPELERYRREAEALADQYGLDYGDESDEWEWSYQYDETT